MVERDRRVDTVEVEVEERDIMVVSIDEETVDPVEIEERQAERVETVEQDLRARVAREGLLRVDEVEVEMIDIT